MQHNMPVYAELSLCCCHFTWASLCDILRHHGTGLLPGPSKTHQKQSWKKPIHRRSPMDGHHWRQLSTGKQTVLSTP